ncbi:hypothetical protein GCM10025778_36310 [Paeniglutamicibacter antarcticus]|uniref:Uncharacterized protein n=1 Tax=Paeniglutamicibacter antarcticus TaxID=494023 RepID=A0ABP9TTR4_9MICC
MQWLFMHAANIHNGWSPPAAQLDWISELGSCYAVRGLLSAEVKSVVEVAGRDPGWQRTEVSMVPDTRGLLRVLLESGYQQSAVARR